MQISVALIQTKLEAFRWREAGRPAIESNRGSLYGRCR